MRKHRYIGVALIIIFFIIPSALHAASFKITTKPIGGRVIAGPAQLSAAIVCATGYGPFMMAPFNLAIPGPFFIRSAASGVPKISGYLLGAYSVIPDIGTCTNPETGAPIPAFEIKIYGVSR